MIERGSADHDDRDEKAGDSVRAVDRALDILRAFKPQDGALTASELLRRVDLSRPTLYRLLRTLQRKQFLIASGDPQRFRLGPAVAQLAHVWSAGLDLRLTVGASGKVILAHMPASLAKVDFDPRKYARELALIKERGFAISKDELIQGAVAVSAPFFDGTGRVAGSLSVFGPSARLGPSQVAKFGKLLLRETQQISQVLGKSRQ